MSDYAKDCFGYKPLFDKCRKTVTYIEIIVPLQSNKKQKNDILTSL